MTIATLEMNGSDDEELFIDFKHNAIYKSFVVSKTSILDLQCSG